jgi:hypothetical protein
LHPALHFLPPDRRPRRFPESAIGKLPKGFAALGDRATSAVCRYGGNNALILGKHATL